MKNIMAGQWIGTGLKTMENVPVFRKSFSCAGVKQATLSITALGMYEACLNDKRVGDFIFAPGWTDYKHRLQVQQYDVTNLLQAENTLAVTVGKGWYASRLGWTNQQPGSHFVALLAALRITYQDDQTETVITDSSWQWSESSIVSSEIYDGEVTDTRIQPSDWKPAAVVSYPMGNLVAQEGERITEHETLRPVSIIKTPKGETVLDFGQNLTGYVQFTVRGEEGHRVTLRHAEVLDRDGNFYTENLRNAKAEFSAILNGNAVTLKPHFTFYGFRYIQLIDWPEDIDLKNFSAIVVYSDLKRTGHFTCGHPLVNRLYENIIWSQKGNFLDVPTDCPQRDERLGWTGDAQVFVKTAAYNFDVQTFFTKWLHDLASEQFPNGGVPAVVPNVRSQGKTEPDLETGDCSAAWGDAACICPWQIYLSYGDKRLLSEQYESMRAWVEFVRAQGEPEALWITQGRHYGDWLGMDAQSGSYKGSTDENLIATAMYANSTQLLIKAGKVLGKDVTEYETLYENIVKAFRKTFMPNGQFAHKTQTAHVLALHFHLCDHPVDVAASLAKMVEDNHTHLTTGFVGTPYLLHSLSSNGYKELAYSLLLQETFPSWLYSIRQGATTIWEHWDGIREDGTMWSPNMNSFNHYAYGSVGDWLFGVAAGITPAEDAPGYDRACIAPKPDPRLGFVKVSLETPHGLLRSEWRYENQTIFYEFEIPEGVEAEISTATQTRIVGKGVYNIQETVIA